jgi:hypothetical protein
MPARGRYVEIEPLRELPALTHGLVREAGAQANARTQTLVQGVQRNAPQPSVAAEARNHEGDHPSWPQTA